ncbi:MAG: hypothetical protein FJ279_11745 [Planctomycetes bacterium]|nr:hypothetical protein [Planctomycetota bacterium]
MAEGDKDSIYEPTMRDLFRAKALLAPGKEQELGRDVYRREWDLSKPDRGNFTFFPKEAQDVQVTTDKSLRFRTAAGKVVLGWGNYQGRQPLAERVHLWYWANHVELKAKQSAAQSVWRVRFWVDGARAATPVETTLNGTDRQTLRFSSALSPYKSVAEVCPDGFEVEIEGEPGNAVEIASLRITRNLHEGCFRKEIETPPGTVWRAIAEVGVGGYLFVNGKEVPMENATFSRPSPVSTPACHVYRGMNAGTVSVDLTPYFKPGKNAVGLYFRQVDDCCVVYLQGQVVMSSGEVVRFDSDASWRFSPTGPKGWSEAGFDDRAWVPVDTTGWDTPKKKVGPHHYTDFLVSSYLIGEGGKWLGPGIPEHDGRLVIENPSEARLFYDAAKPVVARVRLPDGLADRRPAVLWTLTRAEEDGEKDVGRGEASQFARAKGSLVAEINCGQLERGVYALGLKLRVGGAVIEERPREPLVVLGRIPMREVEGSTYEDGLKLTLEDTIDFTNPKDPHPWVESPGGLKDAKSPAPAATEPRIVRKPGLVYRETAPIERHQYSTGAPVFSYQFTFQRPASLYMMVLEYPNDADRWIGVSVSSSLPGVWTNSRTGPSVWTGDKYPLTNTMQELRWIHRADAGPHTVDILPMHKDSTAAATRLRIYRIEDLPALKVNPSAAGRRWFGTYTERTTLGASFGKTFGPIRPSPTRLPTAPEAFPPIPERLAYLRDGLDACERYTRYLRFTGQNLHAMGCFQYNEGNTPFASPRGLPTARVPRDLREMAIRVFGRNGIDVIGVISYDRRLCLGAEYAVNDGQVALGADTALMVPRDGKQQGGRGGGRGYSAGWNYLHPRVEAFMLSVADELAEKFKDQPNFLGVNWTCYLTGEWLPGYAGWVSHGTLDQAAALYKSYDDSTIARFERDTGVRVPADPKSAERFQKRFEFLTSEAMRGKWVDWRCQKMREFFLKARDRVKAQRQDLEFFASLYVDVPHDKAWADQGKPLREFLRDWGHDPTLYRDDDLWLSRWTHAILHTLPASRRPGYATGWEQTVGPEFVQLYERDRHRAAVIMHQWFEINYLAPGAVYDEAKGGFVFTDKSHWPLPGNRGRMLVQPNLENARETFTQCLIGSDPQVLMYGFMDVNMMVGHEQQLREFGQVLRSLPPERFQPALNTGFGDNLAIREAVKDNACFFYVANPGYWPIKGTVTLSGSAKVASLATGVPVAASERNGKTVVSVTLKPFGVAAFRADGPGRVSAWSNEPLAERELAHLREIMADGEERMAKPQAPPALSAADTTYLHDTVTQAKSDLAQGRYASAWSRLTHWRFWGLVREQKIRR